MWVLYSNVYILSWIIVFCLCGAMQYGLTEDKGLFPGKCFGDGIYSLTETSYVMCTHGRAYTQKCPPGTVFGNGAICGFNLVDRGFSAAQIAFGGGNKDPDIGPEHEGNNQRGNKYIGNSKGNEIKVDIVFIDEEGYDEQGHGQDEYSAPNHDDNEGNDLHYTGKEGYNIPHESNNGYNIPTHGNIGYNSPTSGNHGNGNGNYVGHGNDNNGNGKGEHAAPSYANYADGSGGFAPPNTGNSVHDKIHSHPNVHAKSGIHDEEFFVGQGHSNRKSLDDLTIDKLVIPGSTGEHSRYKPRDHIAESLGYSIISLPPVYIDDFNYHDYGNHVPPSYNNNNAVLHQNKYLDDNHRHFDDHFQHYGAGNKDRHLGNDRHFDKNFKQYGASHEDDFYKNGHGDQRNAHHETKQIRHEYDDGYTYASKKDKKHHVQNDYIDRYTHGSDANNRHRIQDEFENGYRGEPYHKSRSGESIFSGSFENGVDYDDHNDGRQRLNRKFFFRNIIRDRHYPGHDHLSDLRHASKSLQDNEQHHLKESRNNDPDYRIEAYDNIYDFYKDSGLENQVFNPSLDYASVDVSSQSAQQLGSSHTDVPSRPATDGPFRSPTDKPLDSKINVFRISTARPSQIETELSFNPKSQTEDKRNGPNRLYADKRVDKKKFIRKRKLRNRRRERI